MKTLTLFIVIAALTSSACFAQSPSNSDGDPAIRLKQRLERIDAEDAELQRLRNELSLAEAASTVATAVEIISGAFAASTFGVKGIRRILKKKGFYGDPIVAPNYQNTQDQLSKDAWKGTSFGVVGELTRENINTEMISPLLLQIEDQEKNLKIARDAVKGAQAAFQ